MPPDPFLKTLKKPKSNYPITQFYEGEKPACVIVHPGDAEYSQLAKSLQEAMRERSGLTIPLVPEDKAPKVPRKNPILLGNLNNNRVLFRLYGYSYTPADHLFPGNGGYLVQTIHDPWGNGRNAIGLLGSDLAGVGKAVDRFLQHTAGTRRNRLGPTFDFALGEGALRIPNLQDMPDFDTEMANAEEALQRGSHTGLWGKIGQTGLLYGLTGNDKYAEIYRELVLRMYAHAMSDPDNYGGIWGFDADFALQYVMPGWDLVEESPVISARDRLEITRILYEFICDCVSHVGNVEGNSVRHNHSTYAALGLHYAGTYFNKYYDCPAAKRWLKLSDKCFGAQTEAFKPSEDCGHYQWRTHFHTMRYTLSKGDWTFVETGNAKLAGDYAILTTDNLGYGVPNGDTSSPFGTWTELPYLHAMVCVTGDGRYQWMLDKKLEVAPQYRAFEHNRQVEPVEPKDLDGTQIFPVDPLYHASNNGNSHLPLRKTFDKVVFRDGFDPANQYLFLDGLSNGGHKHYDGNSICRLTQNHRIWLADCDYIKSLPKFHNGVLIFKNGQSAEIPPFAELERSADFDLTGFSETTLRNYSGVDWHRNILWNREKFFIVIDEMEALSEADYSFRAVWQTLGNVELGEGGMAVEQNGERFFIKGLDNTKLKLEDDWITGKNWAKYEHAEPAVRILQQISNVRLRKGENHAYFNLLYSPEPGSNLNLTMERLTDSAVLVRGDDEVVYAGVGESNVTQKIPGGPQVAAAQFQISPSRFSLVDATFLEWGPVTFTSDHPVSFEYDLNKAQGIILGNRSSKITISAAKGSRITLNGKASEARFGKHLLRFQVGKGRHELAVLSKNAQSIHALSHKPGRPALTPPRGAAQTSRALPALNQLWTYRGSDATLSLASGDLNGDGIQEIVAGGRDNSVRAIKGGKSVWDYATQGIVRSVCAADLDKDGKQEVLAGSEDTKLYALGPDGKLRWSYEIPFYFQTPIIRSVFTGDINGDGYLEAIAAVESWRYYAFTHDGKELWHQMTVRPSSTGCAADLDGDGRDEVIAGTDYHRWHCIDGNGDIRWSYSPQTGPRANSAAAGDIDGDGLKEAIFAGADTHVHILKADGTLVGQFNTGDEVTQVIAVDMDDDGLDEIVASSMSFNVYVIKGDGRTILWRTDLGEVVTCIAVGDFNGDGLLEVAAGVADGSVHLLSNKDGRVLNRFDTDGPIVTLIAADVDGDGIDEIVAASEDRHVYALKT
jgi:hypothetical protein